MSAAAPHKEIRKRTWSEFLAQADVSKGLGINALPLLVCNELQLQMILHSLLFLLLLQVLKRINL